MNANSVSLSPTVLGAGSSRLDYLDATRAFALLLGIVFHASLSFMPMFIGWAVMDVSTSPLVLSFFQVSHSFRMALFFLIAGFFGRRTLHAKGPRAFLRSRFLRLVVPFGLGWFILRPLLVSGWIMGAASLRGDYHFWTSLREGFRSLATLPAGLFTGTHLWFLYYLSLITALVLGGRWLLQRAAVWSGGIERRIDALVAWLAQSSFSLLVLAGPTAGVLWFMQTWGLDTPDRTLVPSWPVLSVYGGFFVLGWLFARQPGVLSAFGRLSAGRWVLAAASIATALALVGIQSDPADPHYTAARAAFTVSYAVMMWTLVALTLGVLEKFCQRPRPLVRYLADSSYWMYLVHLPLVVWLQVAVAELRLPWFIKLAGVSGVTILVALLTYDLFVRSTVLGQVLNGRRWRRVLFAGAPGGSIAGLGLGKPDLIAGNRLDLSGKN